MKRILFLLSIILAVSYMACRKGAGSDATSLLDCNGVDSRFAVKVLPLIQSTCATNSGCHGNGSGNGPGTLTGFAQISSAAAAIKAAVLSGAMPKGSTLSTQDKSTIVCWVNSGALNN